MRDLLPSLTLSGRRKWALAAVLLLLALFAGYFVRFVNTPPGDGGKVRIVEFAKGSSLKKLAGELATQEVVGSAGLFQLYVRFRGVGNRMQAGTYQFSDAMPPAEILRKLVAGEVYERKFALPEGYSIFQAAELLEARGFFKKDDFLKACRDQGLLQELGIKGESAEGYLYPGTYNLLKVEDPAALVRMMVSQFNRTYAERFVALEKGSRLTRRQIVTLASLVEKEAKVPQERPLIASVFHNRLKKGMPLQSDPTAVYGVRAFGGKVTGSDVRRNSAYNTYQISGLPPGPIGNPSDGAIAAVLQPAATNYYYFVARQDGTHQFSATLDEHNRAVNRYLKGKGA